MPFFRLVAFTAALLAAGFAHAADDPAHDHGASAPASASVMVDGEVRKVDADGRKLTLRHGPLPHLDMPAMTMVFQVQDAALLQPLKVGDRVRFAAEKIGGQLTVTRLAPAP